MQKSATYKSKSMKKITLFILVLTISIVNAQNKIMGKVVDQTDKPVKYAEVILQNADSVVVKSEITNEIGTFTITNVSNGTYKLNIQYFSENIYSQIIKIENNLNLGVILLDASFPLEEVIITTKTNLKKKVGKYVVTNISSSKFAQNKTTYDFLNTLPLLETSPDGSSLKIRNKGDATILINGKNVGGNAIALSMLQSTPAVDIKKIEIIKNPDSKYDASNKNGIINIILKNKENEGLKGSISTRISQSFYNSQRVNGYLSFSKKKWIITSGVRYNNSKNKLKSNYIYKDFLNNVETSININTSTEKNNFTPFLNVNYNINKKHTIGLQFNSIFSDNNSYSTTNSNFHNINNAIIDSTNTATIKDKVPNVNTFFSNINYKLKTDSLGSHFEVNLNFYKNKKNKKSFNNFNYSNSNPINFILNPNIETTVYNLKTDFSKNFRNKDKMNIGISYTNSDIDNNFFFGNFNGLEYISNPQQTNKFKYKDYTYAGYATYKKTINDKWEGKVGLRLEYFESEGKTNNNPNTNNLSNTYLFPSLSVLYVPNDNHEFSIDLGSSIIRPWYNNLNPFISYNSPTSFKVSNPNLLPTISYELYFNYTFFDDFSFDFEYVYDRNLFNDFDIVLPNGNIQTITDNWGNGNDYYFNLTYSKDFLKGNWKFSASLSNDYYIGKGNYNGTSLNYINSSYNFRIKNNVILNKKQDMILSVNYGYDSTFKSILGDRDPLNSLTVELSKSFNNWYISIGAYDLARSDLRLSERRTAYAFYKIKEYFQTYYVNLRYSFGNKKVKKIFNKQSDINKRL